MCEHGFAFQHRHRERNEAMVGLGGEEVRESLVSGSSIEKVEKLLEALLLVLAQSDEL